MSASSDRNQVDRVLVESAGETLLAWANYYVLCEQEFFRTCWEEDLTDTLATLQCQLGLAEAATRRARRLLAMATYSREPHPERSDA